VSNNKAIEILQSNGDNFFSKLNKINLKARNVQSIDDYKNNISKAIYEPLLIDKLRILYCIYKINKLRIEADWVNNDKFHNLPWSIIMVKNKLYENNYPHTRYNNIILNEDSCINIDSLLNTLLHERLHVYQKTEIKDIDKYITKHYTIIKVDKSLYRVNPDINDYTYMDKNNNIYSCKYKSQNPTSLNDVIYTPINDAKYDHPYEKMVYDLVKKYY
jgi:hypothetical protein